MITLLRAIIGLTGIIFVLIGLNTALGGMMTLGWQFPSIVIDVPDAEIFARHDNNARFFGSVFAGLGLIFVLGAFVLEPLRLTLALILLTFVLGGFFRLLQPGYSVVGDGALLPSLAFELIGAPLLALWILKAR